MKHTTSPVRPRSWVLAGLLTLLAAGSAQAQTYWKGTSSTAWSTAANWSAGVPTSTVDAVIGSTNFTGPFSPTITASATCKNLLLATNGANITLTVGASLTASGGVTNGATGTISHTAGTINLKGDWLNLGTYTPTANSTRQVTFSGTAQTIGGVVTTFRRLTIGSTTRVTLLTNTVVNSRLSVSGTLDPGEAPAYTITGVGTFQVNASKGRILVKTANFASQYGISGTLTLNGLSTVEYAATNVNQNVTNLSKAYGTLRISGGSTKTLVANLTGLLATNATVGQIYVDAGTFDLAGFGVNRSNNVAGGTISVANGATLKIGGTNAFPANFVTHSLALNSTVEYNGTNQTVAADIYGNLTLSGNAGSVTKAMPASAITVVGNFNATLGGATALSFTSGAAMNLQGYTTLGTNVTFNSGAFTNTVAGNWTNFGTYNGGSGTVVLTGPAAVVAGNGTNTFNNLTVTAAGVTVAPNTAVTVAGNLAATGSGTLTHTAGGTGTFTFSGASKTISGSSLAFNNVAVPGSVTTTSSLTVAGDLNVAGTLAASAGTITLSGTGKTLSGAGTVTFFGLNVPGSLTTTANFNLLSDVSVAGSLTATAGTATFTGTSILSGTANFTNVVLNGTKLQLGANSVLGIAGTFTRTAGTFDVTTTVPSTVNYNGSSAQNVTALNYDDLVFSNTGLKTAAGAITNSGDLTISSGATFAGSTFTHRLAGYWINNGTFTPGSSTVTLVGSDDVTISGATTFNNLTLNKNSAANVVTLATNISVGTLAMTTGNMNTLANVVTITGTRSGTGLILGTITRTHTYNSLTDYEFEGPNTKVNFLTLSTISSITMKVETGPVADFPFGGSANRQYTISMVGGGGLGYSATLTLHYLDAELNGNNESTMNLWRNTNATWFSSGRSGGDTTANNVNQNTLNNITGRWTFSDNNNVVRWNGGTSTAWATAANWSSVQGSPSLPPGTNDLVELGTTNFVNHPTITTAANVKGIIFGSAKALDLTLDTGGSLNLVGNISGSWTNNITHSLNVSNQTLTVGGGLSLSDGTNNHAINLLVNNGTVTVTNSVTQSGNANVTFTGSGALNVGGDFTSSGGTFTPGTGTVTYNGAGAQAVAGVTYYRLTLNKAGGTATLSATGTVNADLLVTNTSTFTLASSLTVASNVVIRSGNTLLGGAATLTVGGNWTNNGTFTPGTGTVLFNGAGNQNLSASTFNNLTFNKATGTASLAGNVAVNGNLTVTAGTLTLGSFTANRNAVGGTFTLGSGATLLTATNFPANYGVKTLATNSTVEYNGTIPQGVAAETYGHLLFSGNSTKTLAGATTVAGNLVISNTATLAGGSAVLILNGNWTNSGTFAAGTGTVQLQGTNKTVNGPTTFNHLNVPGSYTVDGSNWGIAGDVYISGSLDTGSGTVLVDGDMINAGSLMSSGTATFTGTRVQNIRLLNAITTVSSGVINFNGSVSPVLNSTTTPQYVNLNINNTGGVAPSVNWTVGGNFTVASGATFTGGPFTHRFLGSVTNSGTITSSGALRFIPTTNVTLSLLGTSFNSSGEVVFGSTGTITLAGGTPTLNDVTVQNLNAAGVTPANSWTLSGDLVIAPGSTLHGGTALTHTVAGTWENNGTFDPQTSAVVFTGAEAEILGNTATTFNHVTFTSAAAMTVSSDFSLAGNFTNNAASLDSTAADITFTGAGSAVLTGAAGSSTISSLIVAKPSGTVTLAVNVSNLVSLAINDGTLAAGTFALVQDSGGGTFSIADTGRLTLGGTTTLPTFNTYAFTSGSTVEYLGAGTQTIAAVNYGNLTSSAAGTRTLAGSGTIGVAGTFTPGGNTYTVTGSTVDFNGSSAQTIPAFNFNNLTSSSSGARTLANSGTIGVAGTFTPGGNTYTITGSTINLNGGAQSLPAFNFNNLTTSGSGAKTLAGHITVDSTLSLTAGSFADGGFTVTNKGNIANGVTHSGAGKILLTGGAAQHQLSGAGVYQNLTVDDSFGAALSLTNLTVNGTLALTTGQITTTTNRVIIGNAGAVTRTAGHVNGLLQKPVLTGSPAVTFEIGGTNVYAPAFLSFTNVTVGGTLLAKTFDADHPQVATSGFNTNRTLNRYWTFTNSATVFSNYQATFQYSTNDLDAGVNGTNLLGRRYLSSTWSDLVAGTKTSTNFQTLNNTNFGDFAFGGPNAVKLGIQTQPSATVTAGVIFPVQPVIRIEDDFGALVTSDNSTVVTVARGSGSGTLQGSLTATAVNGLVTFTNLSHLVAGNINLAFTASGLTNTNSITITVNPAAGNRLTVQTEPSATATAGVAFATQPVIRILDAFNNVVTTDSTTVVTASRGTGTGTLQGTLSLTAASGVVTFTNLSHQVAGAITVNFAASGMTGTNSTSITINPAAANQLSIFTPPSSTATAGVAFATQPVIRILDAFGNLITTDNTTVVTASRSAGAGALQGTVTATASGGVATFVNLAHNVAGNITVAFGAPGLSGATSGSITINPAAANRLTVQTEPSATATAGVAFTTQPVIRILDAFDNVVTTDNTTVVTASRGSGTGTLQGTLTATASSGVATFVNLSHQVANVITVNFAASGITGTNSTSITIAPAAANRLTVQTQPSATATAGTAFATQPVIHLLDAFSNLVTNDSSTVVTASRGTGTGTLQGTLSLTAANGVVTFTNLSHQVANTITVDFAASGLTGTNSTSIVILPAAPHRLTMQTQPSATAAAGVAFATQPVIQILDVFNNLATNDSSTVVLASRGAGTGTLQGTLSLTAAGGVVTYTNLSHLVANTITVDFTAGGLTGTNSSAITITPAPAFRLAVQTEPSGTATAGVSFAVQPVIHIFDAHGNLATNDSASVVTVARVTGSGTLQGTLTATAANGVVTFVNLSHQVAGTITLGFTSPGLTGTNSTSIVISPAAAAQLAFVQAPLNGSLNRPLNPAVTVRLLDAYTNDVSAAGVTVTMALSSGTGSLAGTLSQNTDGSGIATFGDLSLNAVGAKQLTASSSGLTSVQSAVFNITQVSVTPATGGTAISADTAGGTYTALTGPVVTEADSGHVGTGTIVLHVPTGFEFATNGPAPTVRVDRVSGSGPDANNLNGLASGTSVALTATPANLTFTVTSPSTNGVNCALTWENVRVRPTAGTPLASGYITNSGTAVVGVTNGITDFGTLTEVVGAAYQLVITQEPAGGTEGATLTPALVVEVRDQFGAVTTTGLPSSLVVSVSVTSGTGTLQGTTNQNIGTSFGNGTVTFSNLQLTTAGSKQLTVSASGLVSDTTASFAVQASLAAFRPVESYAAPAGPTAVWLANIRGLGTYHDLLTAHYNSNFVSVRLGNDAGGFKNASNYVVGLNPKAVRGGNLSSSQYDDVVTANFGTNTISVLSNRRNNTLNPATNYVVGSTPNPGPTALAFRDLTVQGGKQDIVVANYNEGTVSVLLNNGSGIFGGLANYPVGAGPSSVQIADIDGDDFFDVLTANQTDGTLSILPGAAGRTFGTAQTITLFPGGDPQPVQAIAEDLNGDDLLDLVSVNYNSNTVSVLLNSGSGFSITTNLVTGLQPRGMVVRDLNHDTFVDIAVVNSGSGTVSLWFGTGTGNFTSGGTFAVGNNPVGIATSNFNDDNMSDLVVANFGEDTVSVLLNSFPKTLPVTVAAREDLPAAVVLKGQILSGGTLNYTVDTLPAHGVLSGTPPNLTYTPATNYFGTDTFTYHVDNGPLAAAPATVTLNVASVNDAPSFSLAATNLSTQAGLVATNIPNFATSLSYGPTNEGPQTLTFVVTATPKTLFAKQPAIAANGTLTFQPATAAFGTATVTVQARDSGSTLNGGTNGSPLQTFTVTVAENLLQNVAGTYFGLFYENTGVENNSAGYFNLAMNAQGTFSGRIYVEGQRPSISGQFDRAGHVALTVPRGGGFPALNVDLQYDFTLRQVTGTVASVGWTANVLGDRLVFHTTTNIAPQNGKYTFFVPGTGGNSPTGDGYGTAKVTPGGKVTFSGVLADGAKFTQTTYLSQDGISPCFGSIYTGKGCAIGWITFTNTVTNALQGDFTWIKTLAAAGTTYPAGFTSETEMLGSTFAIPAAGTRIVNLPVNLTTLSGGQLTTNVTGTMNLGTNNLFTTNGGYPLVLTVKTTTGVMSGSFTHPVTRAKTLFQGVVLQQTDEGRGYFLSGQQSGLFRLTAP